MCIRDSPRQDLLATGATEGDGGLLPPGTLVNGSSLATTAFRYVASGTPASSVGIKVHERRDKVLKITDPSFILGMTLVRYGTRRPGIFVNNASDISGAEPNMSHCELMLMADDWCPPGTGFNDAFRMQPQQITGGFAQNTTAFAFDPMMYLFYGEAYTSTDIIQNTGANERLRPGGQSFYDGTGKNIENAGEATPSDFNQITKAYCRFEINTDLTE